MDKLLTTTNVIKQHTVPRFLLSNFGYGKKNKKKQIYTFDKQSNNIYSQSVYNATTRNKFYNIEGVSLETTLSKIESDAATIIKKIIKNKSIYNLSFHEKEKISIFVSVQKSRTFNNIKSFEDMIEQFRNKLSFLSEDLDNEILKMNSPKEKQESFLEHILDSINYSKYFMNKDWVLFETTSNNPFYISDNPITLHNDKKDSSRGNLGLLSEGVQIHLPISSTLTLAFYCPSIKKIFLQLLKESYLNPNLNFEKLKEIFELVESFNSGKNVLLHEETTMFLNSLQVLFSEQYIFNHKNEFILAKKMIEDNDSLKFRGTRTKIS